MERGTLKRGILAHAQTKERLTPVQLRQDISHNSGGSQLWRFTADPKGSFDSASKRHLDETNNYVY
jgi:hypothetical protein